MAATLTWDPYPPGRGGGGLQHGGRGGSGTMLCRHGMDANIEGREVARGRGRRRSEIRRLNEGWVLPGTTVVVPEARVFMSMKWGA